MLLYWAYRFEFLKSCCLHHAFAFIFCFYHHISILHNVFTHSHHSSYGGNVIEVPKPIWLSKLQSIAAEHAAQLRQTIGAQNVHLFELGFHEEPYIELLAEKLRAAAPATLLESPPRRIWLACGSGTVLQAVSRVFPTSLFQIVQVGRSIWPNLLEGIRHSIYVAPERFFHVALSQPPYPTVSTYDAKLWQFVEKHGEDGDMIWNVGCDLPSLTIGGEGGAAAPEGLLSNSRKQ